MITNATSKVQYFPKKRSLFFPWQNEYCPCDVALLCACEFCFVTNCISKCSRFANDTDVSYYRNQLVLDGLNFVVIMYILTMVTTNELLSSRVGFLCLSIRRSNWCNNNVLPTNNYNCEFWLCHVTIYKIANTQFSNQWITILSYFV